VRRRLVARAPQPRIFKTHAAWPELPVEACTPAGPPEHAKVVVVVRDPRDVMVSLYYHSRALKGISWDGTWDEWVEAFLDGSAPVPMHAANGGGGDRGGARGGGGGGSGGGGGGGGGEGSEWFGHTLGWWAASRACPSRVLWVRYEDLLSEPLMQVRAVSRFLGGRFAQHDDAALRAIVDASSFGAMKQRHEADAENASLRNSGESGHFRKGKSGDWRAHLSAAQSAHFAAVMAERLAGSGLEEAFGDPVP
jgi:hypothetical protein